MGKCPFIAVQRTREITRDATGKVIEERETPGQELRECLRTECELFNAAAGKCSLPTIDGKLPRIEEAGVRAGEVSAEIKETRENMVASLLHVLKKADTHNDLLHHLNEAVKDLARPGAETSETAIQLATRLDEFSHKLDDLLGQMASASQQGGPSLAQPLSEIKEALTLSQSKFGDILELMLEDHQKRAAEGDALVKAMAPISERLAELKEGLVSQGAGGAAGGGLDAISGVAKTLEEVKEGLAGSQAKFGDILELMLEDHQRKAAEGSKITELLAELGNKQDGLAGAIAQSLKSSLEGAAAGQPQDVLAGSVERLEASLQRFAEAEAKRQNELEAVGGKMVEVQKEIFNLLEAQRNEQRAASNERRRREAEEHNERGVMYFHRRELSAAEREFSLALEIRPDFYEAHNNLGLALSDQGKKDDAVKAFKRAIELAPESAEAYNNLGCLYKLKKDFQQAVELFNQAIAKREDYSLAYFNLGLAFEETEKFDAAIKAWEKVLLLQPTHEEARRKLATYRARRI